MAFDHYALVIPSGWSQLSFRHTNVEVPDEIVCTLGVAHTLASITQGELDAIRTSWETELLDNMAPETTFVRVDAADAGGIYRSSMSGVVGTTVATMASLNSAAIVKKVTGVSGRRNTGRMYLPVVGEAVVDQGGNLTAAFVSGIQASMDAFEADLNANLTPPYILHSKGWNDPDPEPADPGNAPAPTVITGFQVQTKIGTQRRRLR